MKFARELYGYEADTEPRLSVLKLITEEWTEPEAACPECGYRRCESDGYDWFCPNCNARGQESDYDTLANLFQEALDIVGVHRRALGRHHVAAPKLLPGHLDAALEIAEYFAAECLELRAELESERLQRKLAESILAVRARSMPSPAAA